MRVAVLAEDLYNEAELWYPYYRLKEAGARVMLVGSGSAPTYKSKVGLSVTVDTSADCVSAADFDGIVIPGGYAPDRMRRYPSMVQLVRDIYFDGKVVAAICHAGWMLSSAGVLKGKTVTSYFAIKDDVINAGATWVDKEVVVDGNLVTSRQPADLPAFLKAIIGLLEQGQAKGS
jgi:protease I